MKKTLWLIIIFCLAIALRLLYIFIFSPDRLVHFDEIHYHKSVVECWLIGKDHNSTYHPPLFQLLLLAVYEVFGVHFITVQIIQVIFAVLICFLIFLIGRDVANEKVGLISSLIYAVSVRPIQMPAMILSETLFTLLQTLAIWLFMKDLRYYFVPDNTPVPDKRTITGIIGYAVLSGFLFGLVTLTRSSGILLPFGLIGYFLLRLIIMKFKPKALGDNAILNQSFYKSLVYPLIFIIGFSLPLIPWVIRNYKIEHRFIPGSTSTGITFYWHNSEKMWEPGTDYLALPIKLKDVEESCDRLGRFLPPKDSVHPFLRDIQRKHSTKKRTLFRDNSEPDIFILEGLDYLRSLSSWQLAKFELNKLYNLILPCHKYYNPYPFYDFTIIIVLPFFFYGIYLLYRRSRQKNFWTYQIEILLLTIVYLIGVTLVFGGMPRYRDPYDPFIIIIAVITGVELFNRFFQSKDSLPNKSVTAEVKT